MKLVKEHIYEKFQEESDPISDMGIGQRALIKKWFDSVGIPEYVYTIDKNLNIHVKGNLYLSLRGTKITELPDNLSVEGYLDLKGTKITKLPDNLKVGGSLDLRRTKITELPDNLYVRGDLDLSNTKITKLPDNLYVGRHIYKDF